MKDAAEVPQLSARLRSQFMYLSQMHEIDGQTLGDLMEIVDKNTPEIEELKQTVPLAKTKPSFFPTFHGFTVGATAAAALDKIEAEKEAAKNETQREAERLQNPKIRNELREILASNNHSENTKTAIDQLFPEIEAKN